jgi:alpha-galactosidase
VRSSGLTQVWVKPLAGGGRAIALLNRGTRSTPITATPRTMRLRPTVRYQLQNLWTHRSLTGSGAISYRVAPHTALLFRVTPIKAAVPAGR